MRKTSLAAPSVDVRVAEAAALLKSLGVHRLASRALAYLARVPAAASAEVERGAGLRQPEVSVAMAALRRRGWVVAEAEKSGERGRPAMRYRLAVPFPDVVAAIEAEKRAAFERDVAAVSRLREAWGAARPGHDHPHVPGSSVPRPS